MKTMNLILLALLLGMSNLASAQTKAQIKAILEQFCVENYDNYFAPRQYVEGTLVITSVDIDEENNKIKVRGTHTCRGQYVFPMGRMTYSGRDFKAELMPASIGIKVRFWRWYESDPFQNNAHWEGPCEKIVLPDE